MTIVPLENPADPRLDDYRAVLEPDEAPKRGIFVAEGRLVVSRLLEGGRFPLRSMLLTEAAASALGATLDRVPNDVPVFVGTAASVTRLVRVNLHQGCLALAERPGLGAPADLDIGRARRLVVLEGVGNPDNVGSVFRSALAFGTDGILLGPGCADPLYRKAIRTSMAATLRLPFLHVPVWPAALDALGAVGLTVVALTPDSSAEPLEEFLALASAPDRVAWLLGSEGQGLSADAMRTAHRRVRIPIRPDVDSLNVSTAAAIALSRLPGYGVS